MDLRKAFDTVDHDRLFAALGSHGIDPSYIALLKILYHGQKGSVHESAFFDILRGVKQGDVLSAILFNCALDVAFEEWKTKLRNEGILIREGMTRLTNTRYADDVLLYAKSLGELQSMTELLIIELQKFGLNLNADKTKILRTHAEDVGADRDYVDIDGDFVKVLHESDWHRYLGRRLCLSAENRFNFELDYRRQQAWAAFHKHRKVILNKHVSLEKRLQYFDACVTPAILFASVAFPLSKTRLHGLDALQRKMLRRIIGWRRTEGDSWHDTMQRMNQRLEHAQQLFLCQPWSERYARNQWRYVGHLLKQEVSSWAKVMASVASPIHDPFGEYVPHRSQGRPRLRWDNHIQQFCLMKWPLEVEKHWLDILEYVDATQFENEYVAFLVS